MANAHKDGMELEVPVLPLRDAVAFPHTTGPYAVNRPRSLALVEALPSDEGMRTVVLVLQRNAADPDPAVRDLYDVGTLARVLHVAPVRQDGRAYVLLA